MKPSDAELLHLASIANQQFEESMPGYSWHKVWGWVLWLTQQEGKRRQQPASVPAELVEQWREEACAAFVNSNANWFAFMRQYVADRAAAYGREQAHNDIRISKDQWAELVVRHPETMQVLFGGQP